MPPPAIRPARADEYDEIARVWMNSWASTGLEDANNFLLAKLRARIPLEIEKGWSLFVADDSGVIAAMLALHLPKLYLDQLFVAPEYQGQDLGRRLLASSSPVEAQLFIQTRAISSYSSARAGRIAGGGIQSSP